MVLVSFLWLLKSVGRFGFSVMWVVLVRVVKFMIRLGLFLLV